MRLTIMRFTFVSLIVLLLASCSTLYPNQDVTGKKFPSAEGETLEKKAMNMPSDFNEPYTLLLIGYKQNSQFDIDRWLIALDFTNTQLPVYELPTIQGMFPRMFSTVIDNGMRKGIPKPLWKGVITIYKDGDKIQQFTGNENPNNARVLLINNEGEILYFYDEGFGVDALKNIRKITQQAIE